MAHRHPRPAAGVPGVELQGHNIGGASDPRRAQSSCPCGAPFRAASLGRADAQSGQEHAGRAGQSGESRLTRSKIRGTLFAPGIPPQSSCPFLPCPCPVLSCPGPWVWGLADCTRDSAASWLQNQAMITTGKPGARNCPVIW